ncbi:MAG: hypothetical protein WD423_10720 [Rhodothermales bacterium]
MASKKKRIPETLKENRPASGALDANDALRLAVTDERFAKALISEPTKFQDLFSLRDTEIRAIEESIGDLQADDGGYE